MDVVDQQIAPQERAGGGKSELVEQRELIDEARAAFVAIEVGVGALAFARIENHYFSNRGFFEVDGQLLRDVYRMIDIPGVIVHGRYDVVCPIRNAWELHQAWPKSELRVSPASGHSAFEPENVHALVEATDRFAG